MKSIRMLSAVAGAALLVGVSAGTAIAQEDDTLMLTTEASGEQELPAGSGQEGATAAGTFELSADNTLTYTVAVTGADEEVSAGHIHQGATGVNGDVVVELDAAALQSGSEASTEVPAEVADAIRANPAGFYFNSHSASFAPPTGVARGQLTEAGGTAPSVVDTGTGGQAAAQGSGVLAGAVVIGAVALAGGLVLRRRNQS